MIGIDQYRRNAVTFASPAQLVMMLFETAIRRLDRAHDALVMEEKGWIDDLHRVREILLELSGALDAEAAPELAAHLAPLYAWMIRELVAVGRDHDPNRVKAVRDALLPLCEGWRAAVEGGLAEASGQ